MIRTGKMFFYGIVLGIITALACYFIGINTTAEALGYIFAGLSVLLVLTMGRFGLTEKAYYFQENQDLETPGIEGPGREIYQKSVKRFIYRPDKQITKKELQKLKAEAMAVLEIYIAWTTILFGLAIMVIFLNNSSLGAIVLCQIMIGFSVCLEVYVRRHRRHTKDGPKKKPTNVFVGVIWCRNISLAVIMACLCILLFS